MYLYGVFGVAGRLTTLRGVSIIATFLYEISYC